MVSNQRYFNKVKIRTENSKLELLLLQVFQD